MNELPIPLKSFKNAFQRVVYLLRLISNHGPKVGLETALGHVMSERKTEIRYPCGNLEIIINSSDLPFWKLLENKKWEYEQLSFLCNLSLKNGTIFDIGAWRGPYTLLLANLVGNKGRVEAFEPMPDTFNTLVNNVRLNSLNNVNCHNIAVSDIDGNVEMKATTRRSQVASILRHKNDDKLISFTSQSVTIDSFCKKNDIIPDGIKIDVEGAEGLVFKGALNTLKIHKPWVVVEVHGDLLSENEIKACWELMTEDAKEIIYLKGTEVHYSPGEVINKKEIPSGTFNVYIRY